MESAEYEVMARVEDGHWWYRGVRDLMTRVLFAADPPLPPAPRVLDAGCGTGANLALLQRVVHPSYLGGFDPLERAVELSRAKVPEADVYRGDLLRPEIHVSRLDLVTSMDVIYIPGLEASYPGLRQLCDRLVPGGRLMLHVPATPWLFSEHDLAVHASERYRRAEIAALLARLGLETEWLTYRLCLLFPAVVLSRLTRLRRKGASTARAKSDLQRPPSPKVSRFLYAVTRRENRWIAKQRRLPWGSSLFAVGRKP